MTVQAVIALAPKAIRKAVAAQLIARNVVGGNVFQTRATPFGLKEAPAINVFSPGSSSSSVSAQSHRFETSIRIIVAATVALAVDPGGLALAHEAIGDLVDDTETAIKAALLSSRLFVASFKRAETMTVVKGVKAEGESLRGSVTIEFKYSYNEQEALAPEPVSAGGIGTDPDFVALDLRVVVGGSGEDVLVTHTPDNVVDHDGIAIALGFAHAPNTDGGDYALHLTMPGAVDNLIAHDGSNLAVNDGDNLAAQAA